MIGIVVRIDPELDKVIKNIEKTCLLNDEPRSYRKASKIAAMKLRNDGFTESFSDIRKFLESNRY